MKIPYFRQVKDYYCGPAALQMVLAYYRIKISQAALAGLLGTTKKSGTRRQALAAVARCFGFKTYCLTNANLRQVERLLKSNVPVIVNYFLKGEGVGHYAVVIGLTSQEIILADPEYGRRHQLSQKEFMDCWFGYHKKTNRRWLLAICRF